MTIRAGDQVQTSLLTTLTRLVARWSSRDVQTHVAASVGVHLDPTQMRALYLLGDATEAVRPSALAERLQLTRPTASKLIARLTSDGLIERQPDPEDGRVSSIALSPRGHETLRTLVGAGQTMVAHALQGWSAADVQHLHALLSVFVDGLIAEVDPAPDVTPRPETA
ncbi:MarR family winged helix-turn-helix transcriptional regulator [Microbacterium stercoris]|uniref:MarR family transcriptional regulator n=1 Tax=Microbacterium stercoris TaxID=2820289 RepID=A0A939QK67_9MICO|nr:MarR family transcriptional regulator [Microbacterium stercoris]MBO3664194.1 MarR family transcriptional regulator [Microbacterium stercoris]